MAHMNPAEKAQRAASFGSAADVYEKARAGYEAGVGKWFVAKLAETRGAAASQHPEATDLKAVDIGAGTGKLTERLSQAGFHVTAVDPSQEMLDRLKAKNLAQVELVCAKAEETGLPDHSFDLITYAACWHWLDHEAASAEAARLLKADGLAALVWNRRDRTVPWVERLHQATRARWGGGASMLDIIERPPIGQALEWVGAFDLPTYTLHTTPEAMEESVKTFSRYIVAPQEEQQTMLEAMRHFLASDPDLAGKQQIEIPSFTKVILLKPKTSA